MKSILLFSKDVLNWSKVTVKTFIMSQNNYILNKCCSFKLSIHRFHKKKIAVFNSDNSEIVSWLLTCVLIFGVREEEATFVVVWSTHELHSDLMPLRLYDVSPFVPSTKLHCRKRNGNHFKLFSIYSSALCTLVGGFADIKQHKTEIAMSYLFIVTYK